MIEVNPHHRKAIYSVPNVHSPVRTRRKVTSLWNFSGSPKAFRLVRQESSNRVIEVTWN